MTIAQPGIIAGMVLGGILVLVLSALAIRAAMIHHADAVWKINPKELSILQPLICLGRGSFGMVVAGMYRGTKVAVKRVIPPKDDNALVPMEDPTASALSSLKKGSIIAPGPKRSVGNARKAIVTGNESMRKSLGALPGRLFKPRSPLGGPRQPEQQPEQHQQQHRNVIGYPDPSFSIARDTDSSGVLISHPSTTPLIHNPIYNRVRCCCRRCGGRMPINAGEGTAGSPLTMVCLRSLLHQVVRSPSLEPVPSDNGGNTSPVPMHLSLPERQPSGYLHPAIQAETADVNRRDILPPINPSGSLEREQTMPALSRPKATDMVAVGCGPCTALRKFCSSLCSLRF